MIIDSSIPQSLNKKKKSNQISKEEVFPTLATTIKDSFKYMGVRSTEIKKPLNKFSGFAVHKTLKHISLEIIKNTELKDGNFLLLGKIASSLTKKKKQRRKPFKHAV